MIIGDCIISKQIGHSEETPRLAITSSAKVLLLVPAEPSSSLENCFIMELMSTWPSPSGNVESSSDSSTKLGWSTARRKLEPRSLVAQLKETTHEPHEHSQNMYPVFVDEAFGIQMFEILFSVAVH